MKLYVCVIEVEAFDKGSAFGKTFLPGDSQICSLVISADSFKHAYDVVVDMCWALDFCDFTFISLGRIYHE